MTHFKYSETQLVEKPLPELRQLHRQIGAEWEVGDDQRKKANWIKSILNHQANVQERIPAKEESKIFTEIDTNAQPGDYFRLPFKPIVQVVSRELKSRKDAVVFVVETVSGDREQWEIALTTTPQPAPQQPQPQTTPVDPLDKPFDQLTKEEWEQLKRYSNPDNSLSIEPVERAVTVTQKLSHVWSIREGAVPRGAFYQNSRNQYVTDFGIFSTKSEAVEDVLGHCPPGLFPEEYTYLHYDTFTEGDRGSGRRKLFKVFHRNELLGVVMEAVYDTETYYLVGHEKKYSTLPEAAVALHNWFAEPFAA